MSSDAATILGRLTQFGCRVTAQGDVLRVEAQGVVPADLLQAARAHKAGLLELVSVPPAPPQASPGADKAGIPALLRMPLDQYAAHGAPLEIRVPWWPQTLWFAPADQHAARLEAEGISRGRIWTAGELLDLLAVGDGPAAPLLAIAKLEFAGEVVEVRPRD